MTFEEWYKQYQENANYLVVSKHTANASWKAGQREAIALIKWLHEEMKAGADDYEGSADVERFLGEYND